MKLSDYKSNEFSQFGEDGILEKILSMLPKTDRWCCEFGAWDGLYMMNTRSLILKGYSAVLIEADAHKFKELARNYQDNSKVVCLNTFVGFEKNDSLDQILREMPIPLDFDFLSVDIDGNDYHVWAAFDQYRPKVVCIEFNPTIPTEVDFVQPKDPKLKHGCSLASLVKLGKERNYELVATTDCNAIFVDARYYGLFEIDDNSPQALRDNCRFVTYMFSGMDGEILLSGACYLPWHEVRIGPSQFQAIPKFLREYPSEMSCFKQRVLSLHKFALRVARKLFGRS